MVESVNHCFVIPLGISCMNLYALYGLKFSFQISGLKLIFELVLVLEKVLHRVSQSFFQLDCVVRDTQRRFTLLVFVIPPK